MSSESISPIILITNDDGVDSLFMRLLVEAHLHRFNVLVVAPRDNQSMIGRAFTRHKDLEINKVDDYPCAAWSVDGTPCDCVNIAINHLLPKDFVAVVAGMNIGHNIGLPTTLSSGTFGAASEGVHYSVPGIAYSFSVCDDQGYYETVVRRKGHVTGPILDHLHHAAKRAVKMTQSILHESNSHRFVHNVNFPHTTSSGTLIEETIPFQSHGRSFFERVSHDTFRFNYSKHEGVSPENSDLSCLNRGHISHSRVDISLNYPNKKYETF